MNAYESDLKDLENYTFSKHWNNTNNLEKFWQINSYTNKFILNYQPTSNINNKIYNNNIRIFQKSNLNINKEKEKDINYNELNISSNHKNPLRNNSTNNINSINIISFHKNKNNSKIRNFNHINNRNGNNINNLNIINNNLYKKKSISKDNKIENRCKYKTPDKYMNYNNINFITPDGTKKRNKLYNNEPKMNSNKNIQINNKFNYNESIRRKTNYWKIKKALTPDNTNIKKIRNFNNPRNNINNIPYNKNYKNINLKQTNLSNNNDNNINIKKKVNDIYKDINLKYNNLSFENSENQNKNNYYYQKININNINNNINNCYNNSNNRSLNPIMNNTNEYSKYSESCFNNRLSSGSKPPILNKNLLKSENCNKTPSPMRKNNLYLSNSCYNTKNKKPLRYTRSSSVDNTKEGMNKFKNVFRLKNSNSNYIPDISVLDTNSKTLNSCLSQYNFLNSRTYKKNSFYSTNSNSCGYNSSSLYSDISKNNTSNINEKNYNMTQPELNKSSYNLENVNNIYKIFTKSEYNINNKNNNFNNNNEFKYKNSNNNYSQSYNYQSYIESYNNNESIKENINSNTYNSNNYKSEISNNYGISTLNKYNFNYNNKKASSSIGSSIKNNYYCTKLSTNNNTFDEYSNNSYTSYCKDTKRNWMDTIEDVHLNFVNILQNTKNMVRNQENMTNDKIIYNNSNYSVIIVEERDIE